MGLHPLLLGADQEEIEDDEDEDERGHLHQHGCAGRLLARGLGKGWGNEHDGTIALFSCPAADSQMPTDQGRAANTDRDREAISLGKEESGEKAMPKGLHVLKTASMCRPSGRDVAQPGSASHWGCGGRRFESSRPDQNRK